MINRVVMVGRMTVSYTHLDVYKRQVYRRYKFMFKRKIYNKIKEWKDTSQGKTALLIEGARRIGKSTVVEEFARNEYKSYILIDFSIASNEVKEMFEDMSDLNYFFLQLQLHYHVELENRNSVIIFDEVQLCPKARQEMCIRDSI